MIRIHHWILLGGLSLLNLARAWQAYQSLPALAGSEKVVADGVLVGVPLFWGVVFLAELSLARFVSLPWWVLPIPVVLYCGAQFITQQWIYRSSPTPWWILQTAILVGVSLWGLWGIGRQNANAHPREAAR